MKLRIKQYSLKNKKITTKNILLKWLHPILIGYYFDYKNESKEFKLS